MSATKHVHLTIARAEELAPGSTIAMEYQIPEIINGDEFLLRTTAKGGPDRIQASCRLPGTRRRDRALNLIRHHTMWNSCQVIGLIGEQRVVPADDRVMDESLHWALPRIARGPDHRR